MESTIAPTCLTLTTMSLGSSPVRPFRSFTSFHIQPFETMCLRIGYACHEITEWTVPGNNSLVDEFPVRAFSYYGFKPPFVGLSHTASISGQT